MARHDLWSEAAFRFQRAAARDPDYAAPFNNLAIAYEQLGRFDEAREMVDPALAIDPDKDHIRSNRAVFAEIDPRRPRPREMR